jgi:hypothetical protein
MKIPDEARIREQFQHMAQWCAQGLSKAQWAAQHGVDGLSTHASRAAQHEHLRTLPITQTPVARGACTVGLFGAETGVCVLGIKKLFHGTNTILHSMIQIL